MDTLTYKTGEGDAIPCKHEYLLSQTSYGNYVNGVHPVISSYRKLLCMNVKMPNVLRILSREGKYANTTVQCDAVRHLSSTVVDSSHPTMFYAVGGKVLSLLVPTVEASGAMTVALTEATLKEELYATVSGETDRLFVLGEQHVFEVAEADGAVKQSIPLSSKTSVKYPTFDYNRTAKLLVVPAKSAQLDLVSAATQKSILAHAWEPHPDCTPTYARFFSRRFADESPKDVLLLTAAVDNTELRFWSYSTTTNKFILREEVNLAPKDAAEQQAFTISVTQTEDYITLTSSKKAFAVVIELHRDALKPHRITTWKMPGVTMCNTTYVGKVAESSQTKFNYELFVATRTEEGFHLSLLDAHKLEGASNTAKLKPDSVDNWFPNANGTLDSRNGASTTSVTAVSSSLADAKTNSTVSEANVASIVRNQAHKFCEVLKQVDGALLTVQQGTTGTMRMLQDSQFREEAQSMGRQFAMRNRGRLERSAAAGAGADAPTPEPGMMSEKQHEVIESINLFVKEVEGGSAAAASTALKALLQKHLKVAVEKASKEMERLDAPGSVTASISSTDSARLFRNAVDASTSMVLEKTREFHEIMRATLETSTSETDRAIAAATQYTEKLRKSVQRLQEEVVDTQGLVARMQGGGAVSVVDPDTLVARAVARAEQGDWQGGFTVALESGDLTVLLAFLEHKIVQENVALVTSPKTLSLPLFLGLCLQLSFELGSQFGAMPLRLHLLHLFYVEWDDSLQQIKSDAAMDARSASAFATVKRELTSVHAQLAEVDAAKLDRKSKNNLRLVNRLLSALLSEN